MNNKIVFLIIFISMSILHAQQGKYNRKSISSLGLILNEDGLKKVDSNYENLIKHYIEVPRFDYNILPEKLVNVFLEKSKNINDPNIIENILQETVIDKIIEILNDPEIQMNRGLNLKDESAFQTFAVKKGKSLGLTVSELKSLMNSAYIYIPFITKSEISKKRPLLFWYVPIIFDRLKYELEGGIIWWKVIVDAKGNSSIKKIKTFDSKGKSSAFINS